MKEKTPLTWEEQREKREWLFTKLPESMLFWPTISKEDRAKIENIGQILTENPNQNVILYFNHTSYIDPIFVGYIANLIDPEMGRELITPMSYYHTEDDTWIKKIINSPILGIKKIAEDSGVITSRVIQSYQIDNPKYKYTKEQAEKINWAFPQIIRQSLKKGKSIIMMISPEGHRSKGALIKAETGIAMIGRMTKALYVPIGIDYRGIYTRWGFHIGETRIRIGKIIKHNHDDNLNDLTQKLMVDLANVLPQKRKGIYDESKAEMPQVRG